MTRRMSFSFPVKIDGVWKKTESVYLVAGDIVRVQKNDVVPADMVLLEVESEEDLMINKAIFTGEPDDTVCDPNQKDDDGLHSPNYLLSGAKVTQGVGSCMVAMTGDNTFISRLGVEEIVNET